jgi:hypothetical protein
MKEGRTIIERRGKNGAKKEKTCKENEKKER